MAPPSFYVIVLCVTSLLPFATPKMTIPTVCPRVESSRQAILGYEIQGVQDVRNLSSCEFAMIRYQLLMNGVVVIRNQYLNREEQQQFSKKFGQLIVLPPSLASMDTEKSFPAIQRVTNYWANGTWKGKSHCFGCYWHKDGNFHGPGRDYIVSILYAEQVSSTSACTAFVDNCYALSILPEEIKNAIKDLTLTVRVRDIPDFKNGTKEDLANFPDTAEHPVFYIHPENGRRCLYLTKQMTIKEVVNRTTRTGLNEAWEFMSNKLRKFVHVWEDGDIVLWDNLSVMHRSMKRAVDCNDREPRMLFRTQARLL